MWKLKDKTRFYLRKVVVLTFFLIALVLILYGSHGLWMKYTLSALYDASQSESSSHSEDDEVIKQEDLTQVVTHSLDKPAETPPPPNCKLYSTDPKVPVKVEIPAIGKIGCIQKVGIDQNSNIAVPTNVHLGGWYTGSSSPGEDGVSMIVGHVLGEYSGAIFTDLSRLDYGDEVIVTMGDGKSHKFEVISAESYPLEKVQEQMLAHLSGIERQLNLITCTGEYDRKNETYTERLVVRAELVE